MIVALAILAATLLACLWSVVAITTRPRGPHPRRSILGIPLCCWPSALKWLLAGVLWGWWAVRDRNSPGVRWTAWKAWHWPGFVHPWRINQPCRHDAVPRKRG
jgi:hypothetical protein